jgi:hypothetical protein
MGRQTGSWRLPVCVEVSDWEADRLDVSTPCRMRVKRTCDPMAAGQEGGLVNPNIVIMGVPRAGGSLVARSLRLLGWEYLLDADSDGQSQAVMSIQHQMLDRRTGTFDPASFPEDEARAILQAAPLPWVLKDVTFVFTLQQWGPLLEEAGTDQGVVLMNVVRDPDDLRRSWAKRQRARREATRARADGALVTQAHNIPLDVWIAQTDRAYACWPGPKIQLRYHQLVSMLAPQRRSHRHRRGSTSANENPMYDSSMLPAMFS